MPTVMLLTVDALHEFRHPFDLAMNPRLGRDVIVLDPIQQLGQAPERIGFDSCQDIGW